MSTKESSYGQADYCRFTCSKTLVKGNLIFPSQAWLFLDHNAFPFEEKLRKDEIFLPLALAAHGFLIKVIVGKKPNQCTTQW